MRKIVLGVVVCFLICCGIGVAAWLGIGGGRKDFVQVNIPVASISDDSLNKIKVLPTPRKLDFNNSEFIMDGKYYASVLGNVDEAEEILGQELLLPADCKGDEVLLEMDTDCTYIEAEPKIARINDELCEINVRIRLKNEGLRNITCDGRDENDTYTKEEYDVNGQKIDLYYFGKETYAVYLKNDISYVYKIHTVDPDVVKSIIETI